MACKYLKTTVKVIPGDTEIGDSLFPRGEKWPACKLDRQPDIIGWATRCDQTAEEGPCWWWVEEHGEIRDPRF
jgi:hypothetical protein